MTAGLMELSLRAASSVLAPVMVAACPTQAGVESSVGSPNWAAAGDANPLGGRAAWASRREGEREGGKQPPAFPGVPSHLPAQPGWVSVLLKALLHPYKYQTCGESQSLKQRKSRAIRLLIGRLINCNTRTGMGCYLGHDTTCKGQGESVYHPEHTQGLCKHSQTRVHRFHTRSHMGIVIFLGGRGCAWGHPSSRGTRSTRLSSAAARAAQTSTT